jgi:ATP-dependent DNA helicase RecQ
MICDILRGSINEKIIRGGLDTQTTYGLKAEYKEPQVREMIDHLEFEGYIEVKGNEYPTLALTVKSNGILFGEEKIVMKQAKPREPAVRKTKKGRVIESVDRNLYAELKALRRVIADEKNVPAYIVFSDATLVDMCKKLPTTLSEMLEVSGVGSVKLNMYGERFLQVLKSYLNLK